MADFFDRLRAKAMPSLPLTPTTAPRSADADGVKTVAAQPRLRHPFERPATAGDIEWDQQELPESEHSRRGNTMELRAEPTFGTRSAVPALPRSDERVVFQPRPDDRSSADRTLRPLIITPTAAEQERAPFRPPTLPIEASQGPPRLTAPTTRSDSSALTPILGSPADRGAASVMPADRHASSPAATPPPARPAERGAPPVQRAASAPRQPSVTVRIGRLEVRAATPPSSSPSSRPERRTREPALKLDAYLAREGGRR